MFELTIDEDGAIIIPEKVLSELKLRPGDRLRLETEDGRIILEKGETVSREEYESLIEEAKAYAEAVGIDVLDAYQLIEEYIAELN